MTAADGFRDRNHRYSWLVARETARRVREDPALLAQAAAHLERFSAGDPAQAAGYRLWRDLIGRGAEAVACGLLARTPAGDYLRETAPSFGGLPGPVRTALLREAAGVLVG